MTELIVLLINLIIELIYIIFKFIVTKKLEKIKKEKAINEKVAKLISFIVVSSLDEPFEEFNNYDT